MNPGDLTPAEAVARRVLAESRVAESHVRHSGRTVAADGWESLEVRGASISMAVTNGAVAALSDVPSVLTALGPSYARIGVADLHALWELELRNYAAQSAALGERVAAEGADPQTRRAVGFCDPMFCRTAIQVMWREPVLHVVAMWRSQCVVPLLPLDLLGALSDGLRESAPLRQGIEPEAVLLHSIVGSLHIKKGDDRTWT